MSEDYINGFLEASMNSISDKKEIYRLQKEVVELKKLVKTIRVYGNMCEMCNKENISPVKDPKWILKDPPIGRKRARD